MNYDHIANKIICNQNDHGNIDYINTIDILLILMKKDYFEPYHCQIRSCYLMRDYDPLSET